MEFSYVWFLLGNQNGEYREASVERIQFSISIDIADFKCILEMKWHHVEFPDFEVGMRRFREYLM